MDRQTILETMLVNGNPQSAFNMVSIDMQMSHTAYRVLDKRLDRMYHLAREYLIADMAVWLWCGEPGRRGVDPNDFQNVRDWFDRVAKQPAVKRAIKVLSKESV